VNEFECFIIEFYGKGMIEGGEELRREKKTRMT
jgi:hypothetical protein